MKPLIPILALLTIVLGGCYDSHNEPSAPHFAESDNCDISELQALCRDGRVDIASDMVCICRITSSDHEGNFYRSVVVEDESGGAEIRLGIYNSASHYPVGLVVALHLDGTAIMFENGVLQIGLPPQESDALPREMESQAIIDKHIVRSTTIEPIEPARCDIARLDDSHCGRFIALDRIVHAPLTECEEETMVGYHRFADGEGNAIFTYISPYADFSSLELPVAEIAVQGILYRESVGMGIGEQYVIKPRFADDITTLDSVY